MSYVSPELRPKFETLSIELKDMILERNVELNTIHDLIRVLEEIGKDLKYEKKRQRNYRF